MVNASYFTYDGVFSGVYGLMIADFNSDTVTETPAFSPTFNTIKPSVQDRFFHNGISYDSPPQYQFSILSDSVIVEKTRREIVRWLLGRDSFKTLVFHQPDLEAYAYNCVFTAMDIIYVNGYCHGFRVTATFDSPYQICNPTVLEIVGDETSKTVEIENCSDILDDYTYPYVEISANADGAIKIINETDDSERQFSFTGVKAGETIVVDNEMRYIKSSLGVEKLSTFSKHWLRLKPGTNTLTVTGQANITITCPNYAKIGF